MAARNDFTEAILSVMSEYRHQKKESGRSAKRTPPVMSEKGRRPLDPLSQWMADHNIKSRHIKGTIDDFVPAPREELM